MRLDVLDLARFVGIGLICLCLDACGLTDFKISSGDPYVNITEEIQPAKSTMPEVRALLGEPYLSSREWRVDIFSRQAPRTTYTIYWIYPVWWEKDSLDEYLMVTYSDQGVVTGIRSYEGGHCDFKCGGKIKIGYHQGLDLFVWGNPINLFASREDTARLVATEPGPDECVLYLIPGDVGYARLVGNGNVPIYLDGQFVQYAEYEGFFRLVVRPGDHVVSSLIESEWNADSTPGHPLMDSELNEGEHRTQFNWAFSCTGGATLAAVLDFKRTKWWGVSTTYCVISPVSVSQVSEVLRGRRMIIPFDPVQ